MSVSFEFDRLTRTYSPEEVIHVNGTVSTPEPIKYKEISCVVYCTRTLDLKGHGLSGFDNHYAHTPESTLWSFPAEVDWPRTIEDGYKFSFDFKVPRARNLTESVRGKYISVDYFVEMVIKRGMFQSDVQGVRSFFVVYPPAGTPPAGVPIEKTMDKKDMKRNTPPVDFHAKINLETNVASFKHPPRGTIVVTDTRVPIHAITVSYMRTEKIYFDKSNPQTFVSEVCRMQIAENDPPANIEIPFNLEWVRVLISPDVETSQFSLSVSLKVRILFENQGYASTTVPLQLTRDLPY